MPFSCFPTSFTVFERPFLFSNILFLFSNIFSSYRIAYSVVNRYVTTYINLIRLLTWGATNQDMSLFMKSRLGGCYKTRHVTKRDVLLLAALRYVLSSLGSCYTSYDCYDVKLDSTKREKFWNNIDLQWTTIGFCDFIFIEWIPCWPVRSGNTILLDMNTTIPQ